MATGIVLEDQTSHSHQHHFQFQLFDLSSSPTDNMERPPSPMGPPTSMSAPHMAPPAQPEPNSPPDHRGPPPPAYRYQQGYAGAPPATSSSNGYAGYPPYGGYGGPPPPQGPYGGSVPPQNHHPQQYPPSYGYGYPPSASRTPYGYGSYEGYPPGPPQQRKQSHGFPPHRGSPSKGSPPSNKSTPTRSPPSDQQPKIIDPAEVDRLRAAAATEVTAVEVKPIRTDFHFFMMETRAEHLAAAEEEVRKTCGESQDGKLDRLLVNTNLNTRMMKAWEDLPKEKRAVYMQKEEEDRRRFMEEDEIASRHCATLTARGKSPKSAEKTKSGEKEEGRQESETKPTATPPRDAPHLKKEGSADQGDVTSSDTFDLESHKKRLTPPDLPTDDSSESPTKKTKVE